MEIRKVEHMETWHCLLICFNLLQYLYVFNEDLVMLSHLDI